MRGYVLVAQGDITELAAHAVGYSTDRSLSPGGQLTSAFEANLPTFGPKYAELRASLDGYKPHAGESFWIDLERDKLPRGVMVTVATESAKPREERSRLAVLGALECAKRELEARSVKRPWLVALPTYLTGDGGARHDRLTVAEAQIDAAYEFVLANDDVDVVFVPYTVGTYQVWLDARRRVEARRGLSHADEPPAELVHALSRGEGVVFVGAGVSSGSGLPSWQGLIDDLASSLEVTDVERRTDLEYLLDLAQWYRDRGEPPAIEDIVRDRFTAARAAAKPTLAHYLLTALPARYFVTTNYDDLLEVALRGLRRHPELVVSERDVARTGGADACYVVKFHGCAVSGGDVVLSRDDYDEFFRRRPAMALLLEGLLLNQTFFFVGYGLRDPDFRQILSRIAFMLRGAKRLAFATTFDPMGEHLRKQWRNKHLEIVDVEGPSAIDKARRLNHWLDRIAEHVSRDPHLFLADDVPRMGSEEVEKLREGLLDLSSDLADACARAAEASRSEAIALADLLRFFVGRGWRGRQTAHIAGLFAALSVARSLTLRERRDLLVQALRHTESAAHARQLEQAIRDIEEQVSNESRTDAPGENTGRASPPAEPETPETGGATGAP